MRRLIALVVLSLALVGACGGDGDDSSSDTTAGGSDTTAAAAANANASAGAFGTYCGARAGLATPNPSAFAGGGDVKATFENAAKAMDQAVANAPSEIKKDVETVVEAARPFYKFMADNNYDYMQFAQNPQKQQELQALSEKFNEEKVKAAAERIENWAKEHCK